MTVYAITDTKKGEQGLRLLIFKLPLQLCMSISFTVEHFNYAGAVCLHLFSS